MSAELPPVAPPPRAAPLRGPGALDVRWLVAGAAAAVLLVPLAVELPLGVERALQDAMRRAGSLAFALLLLTLAAPLSGRWVSAPRLRAVQRSGGLSALWCAVLHASLHVTGPPRDDLPSGLAGTLPIALGAAALASLVVVACARTRLAKRLAQLSRGALSRTVELAGVLALAHLLWLSDGPVVLLGLCVVGLLALVVARGALR